MQKFFSICIIFLAIPGYINCKAIPSFSKSTREIIDFDWEWKFSRGEYPNGEEVSFNDQSWRKLNLPHDWSIEGTFDKNNASGDRGAYLPGGIGWYRKRFTLPESYHRKKVLIEFDGIYWQSKVWINGKLLGFRPNGFVSFYYDLTEYLNFGDEENVIAVRVDNSVLPNERWYTGSGIYRHTRLIVIDPLHIKHWGTYITAEEIDIEDKKASLDIKTVVTNEYKNTKDVILTSNITDPDGKKIGAKTRKVNIMANDDFLCSQNIKIESVNLWSPSNPKLYTLHSILSVNGKIVDNLKTNFGIRKIHFDADCGLFLNGKPILIKGMCNHHDLGPLGAKFVDKSLERRLRMLKSMGCNAIRTAHNPPAPQMLDMCDKLGILVVDEAFDKWALPPNSLKKTTGYYKYFDKWYEKDLRDFIRRDRNHVCIIMWSIGNEIREQMDEDGAKIARKLKNIVREEDQTRPITAGLNRIKSANKNGLAEVLDVVGFNGASLEYYGRNHIEYPERKMYGSEIPHARTTRGVYKTTTLITTTKPIDEFEMGDLAPDEVFTEFSEQYRSSYDNAYVRISSRDSWRLCKTKPYIAGEFRWTGFDYLGESGYAGGWPARSGDKGVFDLCGFKKDIYYFYKSRWTDKPVVHILPHWSWPGKEGKVVPIWCYTNCDRVELFLNGESLGSKSLNSPSEYYLSWDVVYKPGVIRAVAKENGVIVAEKLVRTAGKPARVLMIPDKDRILADGRDVTHLSVRVVDEKGDLVPYANNKIHFSIEGAGKIIGIGNGNILSHHDFQGDNIKAFNGLSLAIVQSKRNKCGEIIVTAKANKLQKSTVHLKSYK